MGTGNKTTAGLLALSLLFILVSAGCTSKRNAVVVDPGPVCEEALSTGLQGFSDHEVEGFLDNALTEDGKSTCWIPVMATCLNENREIPHRHLAEAVRVFNKRRYEALFYKAVYRYLADIARGRAPYREEDRLLLEDYCRVLINNARSASDKNLGQAQMVCRKLDLGLYRKFFQ